PDAGLTISIRLGALLATAEGERLVRAMGPTWNAWWSDWQQTWGIDPTNVERWTIAVSPASSGPPLMTHIVHLSASHRPLAPPQGAREEVTSIGTLSLLPSGMVLLRPSGGRNIAVFGPELQVRGVIELEGAAPLLARQLEQMRQTSDATQHVVLLVAPHF